MASTTAIGEEKNVAPDSTTETYVAMKMFIDNWRWSDVPFYIFTGKKLPEKSSEIVVNFKSTPHQLFRRDNAREVPATN